MKLIINSPVSRDFLRANRRSNIHLYPDDWKKLPVPDVTPEQQEPIIERVNKILAARQNVGAKQASTASPAFDPCGNTGEADETLASPLQENQTSEVCKTSEGSPPTDIPALEAEIDRLVYALYGLTDEEIAVVEGKK